MNKLSAIEFMRLAKKAQSLTDGAIQKLDQARDAHEHYVTKTAA